MQLLCYGWAKKALTYQDVIQLYLEWADPEVSDIQVNISKNTLTLGAKTSKDIKAHLLQIIQSEKIILTGNWPSTLFYLRDSGMRELDLSKRLKNSTTRGLKVVENLENIHTLIIRKGQYSTKSLDILRSKIKLIEINSNL